MIIVEKKNGQVKYSFEEVTVFIEEQVKLIPGVVNLGRRNRMSKLRQTLGLSSKAVRVYQFTKNKILIELDVILRKDVNYTQVEEEIRIILKYSLAKKYGLEISGIDIFIQDLV